MLLLSPASGAEKAEAEGPRARTLSLPRAQGREEKRGLFLPAAAVDDDEKAAAGDGTTTTTQRGKEEEEEEEEEEDPDQHNILDILR